MCLDVSETRLGKRTVHKPCPEAQQVSRHRQLAVREPSQKALHLKDAIRLHALELVLDGI